ncbi:helicase-like transcription factor [Saccopteryx leptura]|uniref:helicase-like transcription factor n=1 Tax=Saccopteryx leptura TaxID=249018 RepID=UPI00339C5516
MCGPGVRVGGAPAATPPASPFVLRGPASRASGFVFTRLDGSMAQKKRAESIQCFQSTETGSPTVMLLSLKAGGVGLNLSAASRVFLMDPAWNPAAEDQCFDRCHRLGQKQEVNITKEEARPHQRSLSPVPSRHRPAASDVSGAVSSGQFLRAELDNTRLCVSLLSLRVLLSRYHLGKYELAGLL